MSEKAVITPEALAQWQSVVDLLAELIGVPSAIITRVHGPEIEVLSASQAAGNPYHAGLRAVMNGHYCQAVVTGKARLHVVDARTDPEWQHCPEIEYNMISYLGLPLCWPDGEVFGTICVLDSEPNDYHDRFRRLLGQFRSLVEAHLALSDQNAQLVQQLQEISALRGILPICSWCKRIRDDDGYWRQVEEYLATHSELMMSHSICPDCDAKHFGHVPNRPAESG